MERVTKTKKFNVPLPPKCWILCSCSKKMYQIGYDFKKRESLYSCYYCDHEVWVKVDVTPTK